MEKTIIIISGSPGTGKSHIAKAILRQLNGFTVLSFDEIKEKNFDLYGFDNALQKEELNRFGLEEFYLQLGSRMRTGRNLLIEYPFFQRHRERLAELVRRYGYRALTLYLYGDPQVIYRRECLRDRGGRRHPGHLRNCYHRGDPAAEQGAAYDAIPTFEDYLNMLKVRDYNVNIGRTIAVDVTDIEQVSCEAVAARIGEWMGEEEGMDETRTDQTEDIEIFVQTLHTLSEILRRQAEGCREEGGPPEDGRPDSLPAAVSHCIRLSAAAVRADRRIFTCGNGGSAATASHIANDLLCHMRNWNRKNYRVMALADNVSAVTSISNDYGFDQIFAKQIQAFGEPGDVLWAFSTSGNSPNCVAAVEQAKKQGLLTVGFTGSRGGRLKEICDIWIPADSGQVTRVEELHLIYAHIIGERIEAAVSPIEEEM